jgi:hypothetical protein
MFCNGVKAAKTILVGDVLKGRCCPFLTLPPLDEIKDLLLFAGQCGHTIYMYSILEKDAVKPKIQRVPPP